MDSFSNETGKSFVVVLVLAFVICFSMVIGKYYHAKNNNIIEQDIELQKHNDSIKNAKVIEVKTLDNDSTVKLFYQLIK